MLFQRERLKTKRCGNTKWFEQRDVRGVMCASVRQRLRPPGGDGGVRTQVQMKPGGVTGPQANSNEAAM